jgi:hypothetical protein
LCCFDLCALFCFDLCILFLFDGLVVFLLRDDPFVQEEFQRSVIVCPSKTGLREQKRNEQKNCSRKSPFCNDLTPACDCHGFLPRRLMVNVSAEASSKDSAA